MRTVAWAVRSGLGTVFATLGLLLPAIAEAQPSATAVSVVSAGPTGELDSLAEANEIRVVFSEPMVVLGRIPEPVRAPFFKITPAVRGTFRWSGTTILIFTPATPNRLPFASRYEVTIDSSATAISGRKLAKPHTFAFTTPTVKLRSTNWRRKNGRFDGPVQIALRLNQAVRPADVAAHATLKFEAHQLHDLIGFDGPARARLAKLDPKGVAAFDAKLDATRRAAAATGSVAFQIAKTWDEKWAKPGADLVVLETTTPVPTDSWVRVELDGTVPAIAGTQTPGVVQHYVVQVEPTFFVQNFWCHSECNPERYNPLRLRSAVKLEDLRARMSVTDITDAAPESPIKPAGPLKTRTYVIDEGQAATLEDLGYVSQPPARTFAMRVDATLQSRDGQTLGYPWMGIVENWHQFAFTSFGDGHGVWEANGGPLLPFYARNFTDVTWWAAPVTKTDLMPTLLALQKNGFRDTPDGKGAARRLPVTTDKIQSHGLNITAGLNSAGRGIVWAAVVEGTPIPRAHAARRPEDKTRATLVQVTNLGITVKDSPQNTLVFVTRLDNGAPVDRATVSIIDKENKTFWSGTTNADGLVLAPNTRLRNPRRTWQFAFIVTAEKDGDMAYVGSDWQEGVQPWEFGNWTDLTQADPILRGSVFTDRGVYKLGEEVHVKAMLREDTANGIRLLAADTPITVTLRDSQNKEIDTRTVRVNAWSSTEWTVRVPQEGSLGNYSLVAKRVREQPKPKDKPAQPTITTVSTRPTPRAAVIDDDEGDEPPENEDSEYASRHDTVYGNFLVAAYRRPEFRVDATLTAAPALAGTTLSGVVTGRYLFGAAMNGRPITYSVRRTPAFWAPLDSIRKGFADDRFEFIGWWPGMGTDELAHNESTLNEKGEQEIDVETPLTLGLPYTYSIEGEVEDLSRQRIAGRASLFVHPAPWYIGVLRPNSFLDQKKGLDTQIVAVTPEGKVTPGVTVDVKLVQQQWRSVRRAEGNGFYTWDTTETETDVGQWTVTTTDKPVPLSIPFKSGGSFTVIATAKDSEGRSTKTKLSFYVLGEGYTAWRRYDHQRIDLVPERSTYKPGDTARIMIQSPWEQATALVTTEREGIRSQKRFALTSTQQTIDVPITDQDIPNVFVSVLLIKGRTKAVAGTKNGKGEKDESDSEDESDPGKPAFRLGYTKLQVEDASKKLTVRVKSNKEEFRPATEMKVEVEVADVAGKPARSEVTLWAVDYGVLSLTAYKNAGSAEVGLHGEGAAGVHDGQPSARDQPSGAHAEGRG
jgi:alpha-2-macroglobulin